MIPPPVDAGLAQKIDMSTKGYYKFSRVSIFPGGGEQGLPRTVLVWKGKDKKPVPDAECIRDGLLNGEVKGKAAG